MRELRWLEKFMAKRPGFWFFQSVGWFIMIVTDVIQMYDSLNEEKTYYLWTISLVSCFSLTLVLRKIYRYYYSLKKSIYFYLLFLIPISAFIAAFIWIVIIDISSTFIHDGNLVSISQLIKEKYTLHEITLRLLNFSWVTLAWSFLYFGLKFWMDLLEAKDNIEKAKLMAQKSQLQMLRYQLNPHFLFNSLNSIQALIYTNPAHADKMLTELADFLRYTLGDSDKLYINLEEEIKCIEKYLSMEKTRFPDRLNYSIHVSEEASKREVISFLLQPFVENATKYGLKSSNDKIDITVECLVEKGTLIIMIKNSGKWVDNGERKGTGIHNIFQRLNNAYPGKHNFRIEKGENSVCVIIEILQ